MHLPRLVAALIAAGAAAAGTLLAGNHPLWPATLLAVFVGWSLLVAWRPDLWIFVVPALLPLADFSPWSGWLTFDEFDLLVLGAVAGATGRLALSRRGSAQGATSAVPNVVLVAAGLFIAASTFALWRGISDAGGPEFGWFQSYVDPMNSARVFKPLMLALLLLPAMRWRIAVGPERAMLRLGAGMATGLAIVTLAVLWERCAYVGLADFSRPYRAVALFWEMHVGGAAIDAYLAMAAPFAAWALWRARTPLQWAGAAILALLTGYACLTTFSRGVYLAVAVPMMLLGVVLWRRRRVGNSGDASMRQTLLDGVTVALLAGIIVLGYIWRGLAGAGWAGTLAIVVLAVSARPWRRATEWRRVAGRCLAVALVLEVVAVMWTGSFLIERVNQSDRDFRSRVVHWSNGLDLLRDAPDWAFGIGLGRLPAHFTRSVPGYEFPGEVQLETDASGRPAVRISGPPTLRRLEGLYALTQRVAVAEGAQYRVEFDVRAPGALGVLLNVCTMHLLYEAQCQSASVDIAAAGTSWQHLSVLLEGPALKAESWFAPRMAVFGVAVLGAGASAEFSNFALRAGDSGRLLRNGDFSRELAHWFASAQSYFVPWHIDNLYLELLVERGLPGLLAVVVLAAWTLKRLASASGRAAELVPFLAASIGGVLMIGLLSSVTDAPRTAFLFCFLVGFSALLCTTRWAEEPQAPALGNSAVLH